MEDRNRLENNITAFEDYIVSLNEALRKAKAGSKVETGYALEKVERMANRLGFDIVPQN